MRKKCIQIPTMPSKDTNPTENISVSIVVPVYNSEKYLRQAMDSLLGQTLKNIEVIVVDSTDRDNSTNIIREYARNDPRVRVIFTTGNIRAGLLRNMGIEAARGEYVAFFDSDDYVNKDFYEILYRGCTANKSDVYDVARGICIMETEDGQVTRRLTTTKTVRAGKRKLNEYFMYQHVTGIFSRKLLMDHPDARYGDTLVGEDLIFLNSACYYAKSLFYSEKAEYHYVKHNTSISNAENPKKLIDMPRFYRQMLDFMEGTGDIEMMKRRVKDLKIVVSNELEKNKKYENSTDECVRFAYSDLKAVRAELDEY